MSEPTSTPEAPKPTVAEVVDEHGETHWTAYGSPVHQRMREMQDEGKPEEVSDAGTEVPAPGSDLNAGTTEDGSGDPQPAPGDSAGGAVEGKPRSGSRR